MIPDGFHVIEKNQISDLSHNINFTIDEFSPFVDRNALVQCGNNLIIDRYYGQCYHELELRPAGIYGRTMDLPIYSGDHLANNGFLRVPFRRIPRRIVHSRTELEIILESISSADDNLQLLLRGQTREHLLNRSRETCQLLYGEDSVFEPSLITSASRRKLALEDILPEWTAILNIFLATESNYVDEPRLGEFTTSFCFPLFALSLAQHYGLPTNGLDVTDRLDVALFFALMQFQKAAEKQKANYVRQSNTAEMPVIYVLAPTKRQQFDYESYKPKGFPQGRPDAQSAKFIHIGWGLAENACAERIFLALYLDPSGNFDPIPLPSELFPAGEADCFSTFLERISKGPLPESMRRIFLEGFYTVS
jgi:hypothetical protein